MTGSCWCACQEQVRLKILQAPQIKKRKIGEQATENESFPPEPPNIDGARQVAKAKHHGDRVREALLSGSGCSPVAWFGRAKRPRPRQSGDVQAGLAALAADAGQGRQSKTAGLLQETPVMMSRRRQAGDGRGAVIVVEGVIQAEAVRVVRLPAL